MDEDILKRELLELLQEEVSKLLLQDNISEDEKVQRLKYAKTIIESVSK